MAYNSEDDQEQSSQQNQASQQPGQDSTNLSGGGGGFAGQSGASPGAAGAPGSFSQAPTSSGGWTNLNTYLNANADQSQGIGSTLADTVGKSAQAAQGALATNTADYNNQFSSIPTQAQADKNIGDTLSNLNSSDTLGSDPVNQYQSYLNDNYTYSNPQAGGTSTTSNVPASFQTINGANGTNDFSNTEKAFQTAGQNLADTQTESGRDVLLQGQYGTNGQQYGSGEQSFDQLLLQQNPANAQALQSVYNQYNPTVGTVTDTANPAQGTAQALYDAQGAATTFGANEAATQGAIQTDASTALQNAIKTDTAGVQSENATGITAANTSYDSLKNALTNGTATDAQLESLGITPGQKTYGVSNAHIAGLLNPQGSAPTVDQTSTNQDFTNASALEALASGQTYGQSANLGLTGTAPVAQNGPSYQTGTLTGLENSGQTANAQANANELASLYSQYGNLAPGQSIEQLKAAADNGLSNLSPTLGSNLGGGQNPYYTQWQNILNSINSYNSQPTQSQAILGTANTFKGGRR